MAQAVWSETRHPVKIRRDDKEREYWTLTTYYRENQRNLVSAEVPSLSWMIWYPTYIKQDLTLRVVPMGGLQPTNDAEG